VLFYNCSVFIYSTVAGRKCEINTTTVTVIVEAGVKNEFDQFDAKNRVHEFTTQRGTRILGRKTRARGSRDADAALCIAASAART